MCTHRLKNGWKRRRLPGLFLAFFASGCLWHRHPAAGQSHHVECLPYGRCFPYLADKTAVGLLPPIGGQSITWAGLPTVPRVVSPYSHRHFSGLSSQNRFRRPYLANHSRALRLDVGGWCYAVPAAMRTVRRQWYLFQIIHQQCSGCGQH